MTLDNPHNVSNSTNKTQEWFDNVVNNLRYDQTLLENDLLEDEKTKVYKTMMSGNQDMIHSMAKDTSFAYFIMNMVNKYFKELIQTNKKPNKIALELSDSKVLVWAEIFDDDEEMEDALILAEAKLNAEYSKYGFNIASTIVEESDQLIIPAHYKEVAIS